MSDGTEDTPVDVTNEVKDNLRRAAKEEFEHYLGVLWTYMKNAPRVQSKEITFQDAAASSNPDNLKYLSPQEKAGYIKKLREGVDKELYEFF
jgi:hypothetical protein